MDALEYIKSVVANAERELNEWNRLPLTPRVLAGRFSLRSILRRAKEIQASLENKQHDLRAYEFEAMNRHEAGLN